MDNLQEKPQKRRRGILVLNITGFVILLILTLVMFGVYIGSLQNKNIIDKNIKVMATYTKTFYENTAGEPGYYNLIY